MEKNKFSDWNDLHVNFGIEELKKQIIPVTVERLFVLPLGFKEKEYYYTSSANQQIVEISKFSEVDFLNLMPLHYWESVFPGAGAQRVDWVIARSSLMDQAREKGIFQSRRVRGAGVWSDEGRIIINMGDHLVVDGNRIELSDIKSKYFYTLGSSLGSLHHSPLNSSECDLLVNVCSHFKWLKSDFGFLAAGMLVTSRICGALPIRPHMWITGGAQTGKTTLLEKLIKPIIGEPVFYAIGGTSEAGVRQSLKADAIPVMFDEFETTGQKSAENIAACVELMRAAWSDSEGMIHKGGSGGNSTSFQVKFSAWVSSIRVNLKNDADKSRFTIVELAPHGSDQEHWSKLSQMLIGIDKEYGDRLFARTIRMVPILLANYKKLKLALAKRSSQRFGDQYGMLLAGYSILLSDDAISDAEAEMIASHVSLSDEKEEAKVADHDDSMNNLNTKKVKMEINSFSREFSIAEAIAEARMDEKVNIALQRFGIRVFSEYVAIASNHSELENLAYRGTRWSNAWANSLSRIPGAEKNKSVWMAGKNQKCVTIPIHYVIDKS